MTKSTVFTFLRLWSPWSALAVSEIEIRSVSHLSRPTTGTARVLTLLNTGSWGDTTTLEYHGTITRKSYINP